MKKTYTDIALKKREINTLSSARTALNMGSYNGDLNICSGNNNLTQAIQNRLFTRVGELKKLGHPNYGSKLYQLIGEPNNWRTRSMAELYIRESLKNEKESKRLKR